MIVSYKFIRSRIHSHEGAFRSFIQFSVQLLRLNTRRPLRIVKEIPIIADVMLFKLNIYAY